MSKTKHFDSEKRNTNIDFTVKLTQNDAIESMLTDQREVLEDAVRTYKGQLDVINQKRTDINMFELVANVVNEYCNVSFQKVLNLFKKFYKGKYKEETVKFTHCCYSWNGEDVKRMKLENKLIKKLGISTIEELNNANIKNVFTNRMQVVATLILHIDKHESAASVIIEQSLPPVELKTPIAKKYKELIKLKQEQIEISQRLRDLDKELKDLPRQVKKAKSAIVKQLLKGSTTGQELLETIKEASNKTARQIEYKK